MQISRVRTWFSVGFPFVALLGLYGGLSAVACDSRGSDSNGGHVEHRAQLQRVDSKSESGDVNTVEGTDDGIEIIATKAKDVASPAKTTEPSESLGAPLTIQRLEITHEIKDREPIEAHQFAADGSPVVAFLQAKNPGEESRTVTVVFEHESGDLVGHIRLKVPANSQRWRTWGRTSQIKKAGQWKAQVRDADGRVLAEAAFSVDLQS